MSQANLHVLRRVFADGIVHHARRGSLAFADELYMRNFTVVTRNRLHLNLRARWTVLERDLDTTYYLLRDSNEPCVLAVGPTETRIYWQ